MSADDKPFIWMDDPQKGGGQTLNMGTHLIDITRFLLDLPEMERGLLSEKRVLDSYPDGSCNIAIEHQISASFDWDNGVNSTFFNTTTSFGYKNFEIRVLGAKGIIFYNDVEGYRESFSNNQELTYVPIEDPLVHISVGCSFVSKSFKYFASEFVDLLNNSKGSIEFFTLDQALQNMQYLERSKGNIHA